MYSNCRNERRGAGVERGKTQQLCLDTDRTTLDNLREEKLNLTVHTHTHTFDLPPSAAFRSVWMLMDIKAQLNELSLPLGFSGNR